MQVIEFNRKHAYTKSNKRHPRRTPKPRKTFNALQGPDTYKNQR